MKSNWNKSTFDLVTRLIIETITIKDKEIEEMESSVIRKYRASKVPKETVYDFKFFEFREIAFCLWIDNQGLIHTYQHLSIDNVIRYGILKKHIFNIKLQLPRWISISRCAQISTYYIRTYLCLHAWNEKD